MQTGPILYQKLYHTEARILYHSNSYTEFSYLQ